MMRPIHTWIIFGLCFAIVLAALGWISVTALKLDREARQHASLEENVRLALWRTESALAPLTAQESARPYFAYWPFYAAERAYTRMFAEIEQGEILVPSPLLTRTPPHVLLHFQIGPDGKLTSPQVPTGNMRDLAEAAYTTHEKIEASAARLAEFEAIVNKGDLVSAFPREEPDDTSPMLPPAVVQGDKARASPDRQMLRNAMEWQARAQSQITAQTNVDSSLFPRSSEMNQGAMKPAWIGSALVLGRRVSVRGREYVQGCWLDWATIKLWLVAGVKDLLPAADLKPVGSDSRDEKARMLAALPVKLVPGALPDGLTSDTSPIRLSLLIAWACVVLAAMAIAVLLRGAVSLSERRGAFVSAVTHELRTPLTTFRMYTEMLAEGIVSGKEKRRLYLNTLRGEADRLGHLVENVLAYARLGTRRDGRRVETVTLRALLDRMKDRLARRAEQAGMKLVVGSGEETLSVSAQADTSAVEHILFNLVDNACKYATSVSDRLIHVEAGRKGNFAFLRVRDHGPGIDKRDARRLFRPFCKPSQGAASRAPGIGLGLALSRRLARNMGGDLLLDGGSDNGACFVLTLRTGVAHTSGD